MCPNMQEEKRREAARLAEMERRREEEREKAQRDHTKEATEDGEREREKGRERKERKGEGKKEEYIAVAVPDCGPRVPHAISKCGVAPQRV